MVDANRFPTSSSRVVKIEQVPGRKSMVTRLIPPRSSREPISANSVATGERVAVVARSLSIDPVPKGPFIMTGRSSGYLKTKATEERDVFQR